MPLSIRPRTCKALPRRQPRLTHRMRILLICPAEALTDAIGSSLPLRHHVPLENGSHPVPIVPLLSGTIPANFVGQFDVQGEGWPVYSNYQPAKSRRFQRLVATATAGDCT